MITHRKMAWLGGADAGVVVGVWAGCGWYVDGTILNVYVLFQLTRRSTNIYLDNHWRACCLGVVMDLHMFY